MSVSFCIFGAFAFLKVLGDRQSFGSVDANRSWARRCSVTHSCKERASRQSKDATHSVGRRGPLVADEGTFSVPFSHKQEDAIVALQHSRWHGGFVEGLQAVWPEQFVVQPAVHCTLEFTVSFFSCKGNKEGKWAVWDQFQWLKA